MEIPFEFGDDSASHNSLAGSMAGWGNAQNVVATKDAQQMTLREILSKASAILEKDSFLPQSLLAEIETECATTTPAVVLDATIPFLEVHADRLNFHRFEIQRKRFPNGSGNLEADWQRTTAIQSDNLQQLINEIIPKTQAMERRHSEQRQLLREVERHLGFSDDLLRVATSPFGSKEGVSQPSVSTHALLPKNLVPNTTTRFEYDHNLHLVVVRLLTALGSELRRNDSIVKLVGHGLSQLFPEEDDHEAGAFSFVQLCLLADEYITNHPYDLIALLWRGELSCWQGDFERADECANSFWKQSSNSDSGMNAKLVWLMSSSDSLNYDFRWTSPDSVGPLQHLHQTTDVWLDREESLGAAFIRRCVRSGKWDTDLLPAVRSLSYPFGLLEFDVLPAVAWVWIAENACNDPDDIERYYEAWQNAFLASAENVAAPSSALSSIVVLVGHVLHGRVWSHETTTTLVLARLKRLLATACNDIAIRSIRFAEHVARDIAPAHLTAADRLAIQEAFESLTADASQESDDTGVALAEKILSVGYEQELVEAEATCISIVGSRVWGLISPESKRFLKYGQAHFRREMELPGDSGDFGIPLLQLSNGLQHEIHVRLVKRLLSDKTARKDVEDFLGHGNGIEWASLWRLLERFEGGSCKVAANLLLKNRVRVDVLIAVRRDMEDTLKPMRDANPHFRRINREQAAVLYDKVMQQGLVKKILCALHGLNE